MSHVGSTNSGKAILPTQGKSGARRRRDRPESRSTGVAATGVNQPSKSNTLRRAMWVFQTVMGEWAGVFDGSSASLHTSKRGGFLGG